MLFLIVVIGTLNVALGFGLAMCYGYGPPGLDGVLHALGPLPPGTPDSVATPAATLDEAYVLVAPAAAPEPAPKIAENPLVDRPVVPDEPLLEEGVPGDVREIASAIQAALAAAAAHAQG